MEQYGPCVIWQIGSFRCLGQYLIPLIVEVKTLVKTSCIISQYDGITDKQQNQQTFQRDEQHGLELYLF